MKDGKKSVHHFIKSKRKRVWELEEQVNPNYIYGISQKPPDQYFPIGIFMNKLRDDSRITWARPYENTGNL
jgi:hypothetical protein